VRVNIYFDYNHITIHHMELFHFRINHHRFEVFTETDIQNIRPAANLAVLHVLLIASLTDISKCEIGLTAPGAQE
jgi:hypothetical protein